jgi:hypothetical protein
MAEPPAEPERRELNPGAIEFARRVYDIGIDWYKTVERKAQLLLTANGAFAAILLGVASSNVGELRHFGRVARVETWCFMALTAALFCAAIGFAAASLLSRHQHNIASDFARLGIDRRDPATYREEAAWYFGHLASLEFAAAVELLRRADQRMEFTVLTYNVAGLSHVVLRKHRLINAGWMLTAGALLAMTGAGVSLFVRSQL